jgi:predicted transcriptional regulator of viral defense system
MVQTFVRTRQAITKFGRYVADRIEKNAIPVLTDYDLFQVVRQSYKEAKKVYLRKPNPTVHDHRKLRIALVENGFLAGDRDFYATYRVVALSEPPPEEICCLVHPSAYISHLSAMQRYGLSDRRPDALLLTVPPAKVARQELRSRFEKDYQDRASLDPDEIMQPFIPDIPSRVRGRPVQTYETKYFGHSIKIRGTFARVATIGQTFLDTLTEPGLCGGMSHVLDVWREHARLYLDDIIATVDQTSYKIVRVRAGYILEEVIGIQDARVMEWTNDAARGGSRLLDPSKPYAPVFSERWMISINV